MYRPGSMWTWAFLVVTLVQAIVVLAFEAYVFTVFESNLAPGAQRETGSQIIPTFLTLYIFGLLYQLWLVYDALRLKNTIQVIGLCLYNYGILIYSAIQPSQIKSAVDGLFVESDGIPHDINLVAWTHSRPFLIAIPCIIALGSSLMCFVAWKLYDEFAWTIYKHISADLRMKRRYLTYQIYVALLKFDFFFFLGFTIQFVVIVDNKKDAEFGLTIAAIPVTILILIMASYWTRRENKPGMILIIFLYYAALAYFIFKLVRMYHGPKVQFYLPIRTTMTIFAVITVVLILSTITNAVMCYKNFNQGLKPHIATRKLESDEEKAYMTEMTTNINHGPVPSRMTID